MLDRMLGTDVPLEKRAQFINGTIDSPLRWLEKRVSELDQIDQKKCHIIVDRDNLSITLFTDEKNQEATTVRGSLSIDPIFLSFGINSEKTWTPIKLGEFFKMNRAYFTDRSVNMMLVTDLKNFVAKVNSNIEKRLEQNGSKSDVFQMEVNSNLPASFELKLPIFKGSERRDVKIETSASVSGQEVTLTLISPDAKEFIDNERDSCIDDVLMNIIKIAPEIVIIEQ